MTTSELILMAESIIGYLDMLKSREEDEDVQQALEEAYEKLSYAEDLVAGV